MSFRYMSRNTTKQEEPVMYLDETLDPRTMTEYPKLGPMSIMGLSPVSGDRVISDGKQQRFMGKTEDLIPYHFQHDFPEIPIGGTPITLPMSPITQIRSRWMDWEKPGQPLNANVNEYQLYPGTYSRIIVRPGFNPDIKTLQCHLYANVPPKEEKKNDMIGGADETSEETDPNGGANVRITDVLYSGDLILLTAGDEVFQREPNNSQVILGNPIPKINTNLSKLRFEKVVTEPTQLEPLRYGDEIYIKHSALVNNQNQSKFIKYGERLQSHQDGPIYNTFVLVNKSDAKDRSYVKYGDPLLIKCGRQTTDKSFLKRESDKSISSVSTITDASVFNISMIQPFEFGDGNLCVCPGEAIFP